MNYRNLLRILCWRIFAKLDRPPSQVDQNENTARFIFTRQHFDLEKKVVQSAAFMPPKDRRLSIYRTGGCSDQKVWWLGDWYVTRKRADRKAVLARGDLQTLDFSAVNLHVSPYRIPHPRHANVEGWPDDKASQKMRAVELADRATLFVKTATNP